MTAPGPGPVPGRRPSLVLLHGVPAAVLAVLLLLSLGVVLATRAVVGDQESRLLLERANEVRLVLGTAISSDEATLSGLGHVAGRVAPGLFTTEAAEALTGGPGSLTYALLRPGRSAPGPRTTSPAPPPAFVVVAEAGQGLSVGQRLSGAAAAAMSAALERRGMVATPVLGSGADRQLGFALGGPDAPSGTVVYRQSDLGPLKAPAEAGTAPFHELSVALYDAPEPDPAQLVVATTRHLPLRGKGAVPALRRGDEPLGPGRVFAPRPGGVDSCLVPVGGTGRGRRRLGPGGCGPGAGRPPARRCPGPVLERAPGGRDAAAQAAAHALSPCPASMSWPATWPPPTASRWAATGSMCSTWARPRPAW